jgi:hypothetical protein
MLLFDGEAGTDWCFKGEGRFNGDRIGEFTVLLLFRSEDGEFDWLLPDNVAPRDGDCELSGDRGINDGKDSLAGDRGRELSLLWLLLLLKGEDGGIEQLPDDAGSCDGDCRGE